MKEFLLEALARTPEAADSPDVYAGGLTAGQLEQLEEWATK